MTKYMANHIRTTLAELAEHIKATNSGRKYLHRIATAIEAIDYEIDLMELEEEKPRPTMPEFQAMQDIADEFFSYGINICRRCRVA